MSAILRVVMGEIVSLPWLSGILSLGVLSLACYFICQIFNFKKTWQIILVSSIIVVNLSVIPTIATYGHDLLGDTIALLCAVFAVYMFKRNLYKIGYHYLFAIMSLIIAMGFYQAYISVAATLIIFVFVLELINNKNKKFSEIILSILKIGMSFIISCFLYYLSSYLISKILHIALYKDNYNAINFDNFTISKIFFNAIDCYPITFSAFFKLGEGSLAIATIKKVEYLTIGIHTIFFIFVAVIFITKIIKEKLHWTKTLVICLLVFVLPIAMNFTYLLSGVDHSLTRYALNLVYLLVIVAFNFLGINKDVEFVSKKIKFAACFVFLLTFAILTKNIQLANAVYVKKQLVQETTQFNYTRLISRIEQEESYKYGETTVVIVGSLADINNNLLDFGEVNKVLGSNFNSQATYIGAYQSYFRIYLEYDINLIEYSNIKNEKYDSALENIEKFPNKNCVLAMDGMIFIKI